MAQDTRREGLNARDLTLTIGRVCWSWKVWSASWLGRGNQSSRNARKKAAFAKLKGTALTVLNVDWVAGSHRAWYGVEVVGGGCLFLRARHVRVLDSARSTE